jgi:TRAP transporter TAXI family solute receptor
MNLSRRTLLGAAMAMPALRASAAASWPGALVMGTGRPGGYYEVYGTEWGSLARGTAGVDIAFRASGGAAANILMMEQNIVQLGMTTVSVAEEARTGTGAWTAGAKLTAFRALFPMFPSVLQIVSPQATGIGTLAGLAGQKIGIGPEGSASAAMVPSVFAALGVLPSQLVTGDFNHLMQEMLAGRIAGCAFVGGPPLPAISRIAMGQKLSLIGFSSAEIAQVRRTSPGMSGMVLKAAVFPGQSVAVSSVGTMNFAIGSPALPNAVAEALTLAALRNQRALAALVPSVAEGLQTGPLLQGGIMFHPGAVNALRRFGMDVPAEHVAA